MMRLLRVCLMIVLLAPASALAAQEAASPTKVFNAKSFTLPNGLQAVVVENFRVPVVTHMIWYRAGAADEPVGKSGIAHFLEHLMFKGHKSKELGDVAPGEFSRIIRSLGGEDNAFTSQDYTAYFQSIAREHLETVMMMEAGRMQGLQPPPEEVASENLVILEERRQRTDNDPRAQMAEQMNEALFPNHQYGEPVIGWLHEMKDLTWEYAKAFYDKYYAPNNSILVVSGAVSVDEVKALAEKTYGLIPAREVAPRNRTTSPPFVAKSSVSLTHERIKEPMFLRSVRVPSTRQNKADSLALTLLQEIVGNGPPSRLYRALVVEQKVAVGVSMDYMPAAWDDASVDLAAIPAPGKTVLDLRRAIDNEFRRVIKEGVTEREVKDAITRLQAAAIYARDSLTGPAMMIGYAMSTGSSLEDIEYWPRDIATVTPAQVQDVAKRYFNPDAPAEFPPVEGYLQPKPVETK